jgi:ribosome modulation factor
MELVQSHWNLESLEKAYRHGFMAGMAGKASATCLYKAEVIANAWEAGWQDGREQFEKKQALLQGEIF